jgi:dienelactone hydrolase
LGAPYPAITFGHGFFQAVSTYQSTLEHLATHGYFVIATDSESGLLPNHQNFADDIKRSLFYLEQENANLSSILFGQVAVSRFGASGHSMGGGASILATSQDVRIKALANLAAAETSPSAISAVPAINVPVQLISGSADTIVPVASNGQLMFNAAVSPKILPVIQGGWHCGFQDANGFGCDNGTTITRSQQLAETRRLMTAFFNLYLKQSEANWKSVWGNDLDNQLVISQRNSGIELSPIAQTVIAPVGVNTSININVTNRGTTPSSFTVAVEQRRWIVVTNPIETPILAPGQSTNISFRVRRSWKNPTLINRLDVSVKRNADGLTRSVALIDLR